MKALLLVDMQNDFMPGGALPVADGDDMVPVADALMKRFEIVVATRDWHPAGHVSFASAHAGKKVGDTIDMDGVEQILWPDHCVQRSDGAMLHPGLDRSGITMTVDKGTDPLVDSYSGFFDNKRLQDTGLAAYLRKCDVDELFVCGLATDYCVMATVLDALDLDFSVTVIEDGCRAVDARPGDGERALIRMRQAGARVVDSGQVGVRIP